MRKYSRIKVEAISSETDMEEKGWYLQKTFSSMNKAKAFAVLVLTDRYYADHKPAPRLIYSEISLRGYCVYTFRPRVCERCRKIGE